MKIFMFDIDGTLTPHRLPMTSDMLAFFKDFCLENQVYLVTGSDWEKVKEQVPESILSLTMGIYTCSGNAFYGADGRPKHQKSFFPNPHLDAFLESMLEASPYPVKAGGHIESRPGMINFSIVGRDCTQEQREDYANWDSIYQERKMMRDKIISNFTGLDVAIGGQISLDIYPKGWDKSQAYYAIKGRNPKASIVFFGDRLEEGGNDYPVYEAMIKSSHDFRSSSSKTADFAYPVSDYNQTMETLKSFFSE